MGPLRLNLSKSGIGFSSGVKGLSVSTGSRGTYLNAGRKGLHYRMKLYRGRSALRAPTASSLLWVLLLLGTVLAALFGLFVVAVVSRVLLAWL